MKRKAIVFVIGMLLLLQGIYGYVLYSTQKEKEVDVLALNALQKEIEQYYPDKASIAAMQSSFAFTILNTHEEVFYTTGEDVAKTMYDAIKQQATILNIEQNNEVVGALIIENAQLIQEKDQLHTQLIVLAIITLLEVSIMLLYWLYIRSIILLPFDQLQRFAMRVAGGDLDFPLAMDKKNIFGAFSESFDMMRVELKRAKRKEQEANQSKKELVAKLSHDIKTPVASILAVSELMSLQVTSEKEKNQVQIIHEKANQINVLISNLFHASLEELQELQVHPTEFSSTMLLELLKKADYQQQAQLQEIPECMLVGDVLRLQQVFDNILANAYKYANGSIDITSCFEEQYLLMQIQDHGEGVKEEELPLLFEKFYRGENAMKKSGTGLGLYISRYLMKQMRGDIQAKNTEHGFVVQVYIALST